MMMLFLAFTLTVLLLLGSLYRRLWWKGVSVRLHFSEHTVYAGGEAELSERIENRKRLPLPELEAGFRVPKGVTFQKAENIVVSDYVYKRDIFSLRGMEAVTRTYRLSCDKRGRYPVSQLVVRAKSFFHSEEYAVPLPSDEELVVYAARADVSGIMRLADALLGEAESRRTLYEDPFSFDRVREYTSGDPMKRINWKATARARSLMVNTYASVRSEKFFIYLDISDPRIVKEERLVEAGISAAASLAQRLIRRGLEVGFALNTDPPVALPLKSGSGQLMKIEHLLTEDFSGRNTVRLETLAGAFKGDGVIRVFISKELDRESMSRLRAVTEGGPAIAAVPSAADGGRLIISDMYE